VNFRFASNITRRDAPLIWEEFMPHRFRFAALVLGSLAASAPAAAAQAGSPCEGQTTMCADVGAFVAAVTDFRTSTHSYYKILSLTVRIENRSKETMRLAYLAGSGVATDDQGNRFVVSGNNGVRGIGQVSGNQVDPKFVLTPGESSDARFELMWRPATRNDIVGTVFDVTMALREVQELPANQVRLGREHALSFRSLRSGTVAIASAAAPAQVEASSGAVEGAAPAAPPSKPKGFLGAVKAAIDEARAAGGSSATAGPPNGACDATARCHDAGAFTVHVVQVTDSRAGGATNDHMLRIGMRITNTSPQPLILAYTGGSSLAIDDLGNRYNWGRASTHDVSAKGIGVSAGNKVDPQFRLAPGQSRVVSFEVRRFRTGRNALGTRFHHELALEELELLNGGAVRTIRQHAISIPELRVGMR
jgi:hypothetical protein